MSENASDCPALMNVWGPERSPERERRVNRDGLGSTMNAWLAGGVGTQLDFGGEPFRQFASPGVLHSGVSCTWMPGRVFHHRRSSQGTFDLNRTL